MNFGNINTESDAAAVRYAQLCSNLSAIYRNTLMTPTFGRPSLLSRATAEANAVGTRYLAQERELIVNTIVEVSKEARTALGANLLHTYQDEQRMQLESHLAGCQQYLLEELHAQVMRDIALLRKAIQTARFAVDLIVQTTKIAPRAAIIEYQVGETKPLGFVFRDKLGRATNAATFARAVWRQTLHGISNETKLWVLAHDGLTTAAIFKISDGVKVKLASISLNSTNALPSYGDVRAELFHPNSTAFIAREVNGVSA